MTDLHIAAKQALGALEEIALAGMSVAPEMIDSKEAFHARQAWRFIGIAARALEPVKKALAEQPAQQEPVVFCMHWEDRWGCNHYADPKEPHPINSKPLYTSPPAQRTWVHATTWRGLTYEEAKEIYTCIHGYDSSKRIAQAIEAKLKEKNT